MQILSRESEVKAYEWLTGNDTGLSSKYMMRCMLGIKGGEYAHPWDPSDFGRCHRLLEAVPEMRGMLEDKMHDKSESWANLVGHWDELTKLYIEESPSGSAPKLYALMQKLVS